ncbi:alpha/beta hydrolase, partial [Streptomyces griseorubiginosus]
MGRSGALLTYEGHGHGSVTSGPCMEGAVNSYLTDLAGPVTRPARPGRTALTARP